MKEASRAGKRPRHHRPLNPFRLIWKKFRLLFQPKWVREYEKFKDK